MNIDKINNEIKNVWFKNHVAKVEKQGDIMVLIWKDPKSSYYYTRYVFDGSKIYISGDIGYAIFNLTWYGIPYSDWDISLGYFLEKLEAFGDARHDWNEKLAIEELTKWKKQLREDEIEYDKEKMYDLINDLKACENKNDWVHLVNEVHNEFIMGLDADYWEWLFDIGDETPPRLRAYLIGLKMAGEQLAAKYGIK